MSRSSRSVFGLVCMLAFRPFFRRGFIQPFRSECLRDDPKHQVADAAFEFIQIGVCSVAVILGHSVISKDYVILFFSRSA